MAALPQNAQHSDRQAPRLLRTKAAAAYLAMSTWNLRQMVARGELPFVSAGSNTSAWRFDRADLDHWVDLHKIRG